MNGLMLSLKSLGNRRLASTLCLISVATSVALFMAIELLRVGARESFTGTISKTDLIVGTKGGTLNLMLYTVFHMGTPTENMSYGAFTALRDHPAVAWAVPYSLGDSHRGFRVVGTTGAFFEHYRHHGDRRLKLQQGQGELGLFDVVLGSQVAQSLGYSLGQKVVVTHGVGGGPVGGFIDHSDKPFTVSGILTPTGTPIDRSLYISLEGMEAIHMDWKDGAPPRAGQGLPAQALQGVDIRVGEVTSVLLGAKTRLDVLRLQREVNSWEEEPLMAVIPGVALSEMWRGLSYGEEALGMVALCVVVTAFVGILVALVSSLNERRRELAILRSLGAPWGLIFRMVVLESISLTVVGGGLGVALAYGAVWVAQPLLQNSFNLYIPLAWPSQGALVGLWVLGAGGLIAGCVPAWRAYRMALNDGLAGHL